MHILRSVRHVRWLVPSRTRGRVAGARARIAVEVRIRWLLRLRTASRSCWVRSSGSSGTILVPVGRDWGAANAAIASWLRCLVGAERLAVTRAMPVVVHACFLLWVVVIVAVVAVGVCRARLSVHAAGKRRVLSLIVVARKTVLFLLDRLPRGTDWRSPSRSRQHWHCGRDISILIQMIQFNIFRVLFFHLLARRVAPAGHSRKRILVYWLRWSVKLCILRRFIYWSGVRSVLRVYWPGRVRGPTI
jgi:hypothetical protein